MKKPLDFITAIVICTSIFLLIVLATSATSAEKTASSINENYTNGKELYEKSDYIGAIKAFSIAVKADPALTNAFIYRGNAYYMLGKYEKAATDATTAILLSPEKYLPYYNRGLAYYSLKKYEEALADFTEAISINPAHVNSHTYRASVYYALGSFWRDAKGYHPPHYTYAKGLYPLL